MRLRRDLPAVSWLTPGTSDKLGDAAHKRPPRFVATAGAVLRHCNERTGARLAGAVVVPGNVAHWQFKPQADVGYQSRGVFERFGIEIPVQVPDAFAVGVGLADAQLDSYGVSVAQEFAMRVDCLVPALGVRVAHIERVWLAAPDVPRGLAFGGDLIAPGRIDDVVYGRIRAALGHVSRDLPRSGIRDACVVHDDPADSSAPAGRLPVGFRAVGEDSRLWELDLLGRRYYWRGALRPLRAVAILHCYPPVVCSIR